MGKITVKIILEESMERESTVAPGEEKYSKSRIAGKSLRMPGLKPTDYFLFKSSRELFSFDMRQVFTLGLRLIYLAMFRKEWREILFNLAQDIKLEDLDRQEKSIVYIEFDKIKPE